MNPYEILDVAKAATKDAIKRAYRRKSQKVHPDRGGSAEEMTKVNQAYKLLTDDSRRERYDRTGEAEQELNSPEHQACALISNIAIAWAQNGPECDLLEGLRMMLSKEMDKQVTLHKKAFDGLKRMQRVLKKLSKLRNPERNPILGVFTQQIPVAESQVEACDKIIEVITLAQEIVQEYKLAGTDAEVFNQLFSSQFDNIHK